MNAQERGSLLIVSLWILTILVLFAVGLGHAMAVEMKLTQFYVQHTQAAAVAQAAVTKVRELLLDDATPTYDHAQEPWADNPAVFNGGTFPAGAPPEAAGSWTVSYTTVDDNGQSITHYGASDESGKLDLNELVKYAAAAETILTELTDDQEMARAILDYIDADTVQRSETSGQPEPYQGKNAPLDAPEELWQVPGMTEALYHQLTPYLTVYSGGPVNIHTASREVLTALASATQQGIAAPAAVRLLVNHVMTYRAAPAGADGEMGTADDQVFTAPEEINGRLNEYFGDEAYTAEEETIVNQLLAAQTPPLGVKSSAVRVQADGRMDGGRVVKHIEAVIGRAAGAAGGAGTTELRWWHEE